MCNSYELRYYLCSKHVSLCFNSLQISTRFWSRRCKKDRYSTIRRCVRNAARSIKFDDNSGTKSMRRSTIWSRMKSCRRPGRIYETDIIKSNVVWKIMRQMTLKFGHGTVIIICYVFWIIRRSISINETSNANHRRVQNLSKLWETDETYFEFFVCNRCVLFFHSTDNYVDVDAFMMNTDHQDYITTDVVDLSNDRDFDDDDLQLSTKRGRYLLYSSAISQSWLFHHQIYHSPFS